jgi:CspA family cold shock protein
MGSIKGEMRPMAKQTKKARPTKSTKPPSVGIVITPRQPPSQEEFRRARDLLRQRADALVLELAMRYLASNAAELTTVLDAMDGLAELERMHRPAVGATVAPSCAGPAERSAEGRTGPPVASGISFNAAKVAVKAGTAIGTVKWFSLQKGFGFIVHADTGKDVFVHISAVEKAGLTKLDEGQQIEFELLEESRGKTSAVNLKLM